MVLKKITGLTKEYKKLVETVQHRWYNQLLYEWTMEKKEAECKLRNLVDCKDTKTYNVSKFNYQFQF